MMMHSIDIAHKDQSFDFLYKIHDL